MARANILYCVTVFGPWGPRHGTARFRTCSRFIFSSLDDAIAFSQLHEHAEILEQSYDGDEVHVTVRLDQCWAGRWQLERFTVAELATL